MNDSSTSPRGSTRKLELRGVHRRFGSVPVVDRLDLTIPAASFTALVGPSGCGKTTVLRMMGALDQPSSGEIIRSEGTVSFCFQEPRLLPWRTLLENVALPLELVGVPREERLARAAETLELVHLSDAHTRFPHQLSGGMQMRASIARALISRPTLLLLDEPFSALDEITRHELDADLRALWERERCTTVLITHSIPEAVFLAERVVVFTPQPARIAADLVTPACARDAAAWTSDALTSCAREASTALLHAIEEARR